MLSICFYKFICSVPEVFSIYVCSFPRRDYFAPNFLVFQSQKISQIHLETQIFVPTNKSLQIWKMTGSLKLKHDISWFELGRVHEKEFIWRGKTHIGDLYTLRGLISNYLLRNGVHGF